MVGNIFHGEACLVSNTRDSYTFGQWPVGTKAHESHDMSPIKTHDLANILQNIKSFTLQCCGPRAPVHDDHDISRAGSGGVAPTHTRALSAEQALVRDPTTVFNAGEAL